MWKYSIRIMCQYADHKGYYPVYDELHLLTSIEQLSATIDTSIFREVIRDHQTSIMYRIISNAILLHTRIPIEVVDKISKFILDWNADPCTARRYGNYTQEEMGELSKIVEEYRCGSIP